MVLFALWAHFLFFHSHECDNQMGNSNISDHTYFFVLFRAMHACYAVNPSRFWRRNRACFIFYGLFIWKLLKRFIEYWKITERVLCDHRMFCCCCCSFFLSFFFSGSIVVFMTRAKRSENRLVATRLFALRISKWRNDFMKIEHAHRADMIHCTL